MKSIGGYFSLELPLINGNYIHNKGIYLNSGRNALEYILSSIPNIHCLWIPYYTCDVILEPLKKMNIPYHFYSINERLEMVSEIELDENEYLLVTNYFGIKDTYIKELAFRYGKHLIVDNAQAFFTEPIENIKTIYSPRKFIGVPDGGIAYIENGFDTSNLERDISYNRCSHLLKRLDLGAENGYLDFRENSHSLVNQPIKKMSELTSYILHHVEFDSIKKQRRKNFIQLHRELSGINKLNIPELESFACPMVYPFYVSTDSLKKRLIEDKIYIATYWPNVLEWRKSDDTEYILTNRILPLPIDQRYGEDDMERILRIINKELISYEI